MHRNNYKYQYKLMNPQPPPGSTGAGVTAPPPLPPQQQQQQTRNLTITNTQNGKSIRAVLSAQSVIRLKEPYKSIQNICNGATTRAKPLSLSSSNGGENTGNNKQQMTSGLIRASTYNSTANSSANPVQTTAVGSSMTRAALNGATKYLPSFASHPRLYPHPSCGNNNNSSNNNNNNKNALKRSSKNLEKTLDLAIVGGVGGVGGNGRIVNSSTLNRNWQIVDSIEQILIKSKNPLTNDELKKFAYKQQNVFEPHCNEEEIKKKHTQTLFFFF